MSRKNPVGLLSLGVALWMLFSSQLAIASSDGATLTAGGDSIPCPPIGTFGYYNEVGYFGGSGGFGSYSPTGLTGGKTVVDLYDIDNFGDCAADGADLAISGFSSDPGSTWLTSVTCNGITNSRSSAVYLYSSFSNTAFWSWGTRFGFSSGTMYSCSIVHN